MYLLPDSSVGQKSVTGLIGLESRCQQGCVPPGGSGSICFLALSSFERLPALLGLWPLPPSSTLHLSDHSSVVTAFSDHRGKGPPLLRSAIRLGPPSSKILNHLRIAPLSSKLIGTGPGEQGVNIFWGEITLPTSHLSFLTCVTELLLLSHSQMGKQRHEEVK